MTTCPNCGHVHDDTTPEVAIAQAEASADAAESYAEAEQAAEDERTERNADDNDTAEAIAQTQADAAVEIARVEADAEVAIAEADAAADVAIAEALADDTAEDAAPGEEAGEGEDLAGPEGEVAAVVTVPPQLDEPEPAPPSRRAVSRFRSHRHGGRR